jgi:hypothetical protein
MGGGFRAFKNPKSVSNGRRGHCRKGLELDFINALGMIKKAKSKKVKKILL